MQVTEQDPVIAELNRQSRAVWRRWRWPLIILALLIWLPLFIDLIRDLWVVTRSRGEEFLGLPDEFFATYASWAPSLYQLSDQFVYSIPVLRRLAAISAAVLIAGSYFLPRSLADDSNTAQIYRGFRGVSRRTVYFWMAVLLLLPALLGMAMFYGDYRLSLAALPLLLPPALLLLADWLSLCELVLLLVRWLVGRGYVLKVALALLVALVYMAVNYYAPIVFDLNSGAVEPWLVLLVNGLLVLASLMLAVVWWWLGRRPPRGFVAQASSSRLAQAPPPASWVDESVAAAVHGPLAWLRGRWLASSVVLGATLLIVGLTWLQVVRAGVLWDPDCWPEYDETIPVISTRGHCHRGRLSVGTDPYAYVVTGQLPGLTGDAAAPADLLIVIHGFNNDELKACYKFDVSKDSLNFNGYAGALAGFSWDADTQRDPLGTTGYHAADTHAALNGPKLARFVTDYKAASPQTRVHVIGYSMGARAALEALKALADDPAFAAAGCRIDTVHLLGASIDNEAAELGKRYGAAIEARADHCYNYYSVEDNALAGFYGFKEVDYSLGQTGIEDPGQAPANYTDVDAAAELLTFDMEWQLVPEAAGDNHKAYLGTKDERGTLLDDGAVNLIVAAVGARPGW